jgi:gamma-butyrobetaine dioxygenase
MVPQHKTLDPIVPLQFGNQEKWGASNHSSLEKVLIKPQQILELEWSTGLVTQIHFLSLRDNCGCPRCYHPTSRQRLVDSVEDIPLDISIKDIELAGDQLVNVIWQDGHKSSYSHKWLLKASLVEQSVPTGEIELWDRSLTIPRAEFLSIMTSDESLRSWIESFHRFGLSVISNAPRKSGQLERFASRVAFLRETVYGSRFLVQQKADANNLAFTDLGIKLHTDLPFYKNSPGVQMLHCIRQAQDGGENLFVDGFYAADVLHREFPRYFEILSKTPVRFRDVGSENGRPYFLQYSKRIIELDDEGIVSGINYNNHCRDTILDLDVRSVGEFYRAYFEFSKILHSPECVVKNLLKPGDILVFHNTRILHGREAIKSHQGAERCLEGGYIEWDELLSRYRGLVYVPSNNEHSNE